VAFTVSTTDAAKMGLTQKQNPTTEVPDLVAVVL
jgi:hypothetical protein